MVFEPPTLRTLALATPEQCHLRLGADVADFIRKMVPVSHLEAALPLSNGSSESSFFVTEEL